MRADTGHVLCSARPLLIRQGVMRQLQQVVKHCQGTAHAVIARKVQTCRHICAGAPPT